MLQKLNLALALAVLINVSGWARADDEKIETFTDPKAAGDTYKIQGEYTGNFDLGDGNEQKFALQVIALGDAKYHGIAYFGGLPGDGWDGFTKLEADGEEKDGVVTLKAAEGEAVIEGDTAKIQSADGQELGSLKKTERKSPTLGAKPPEGAVVLFDGTNADEWEGGKVVDGLLAAGALSKKKFQDFSLHLEFRTPFMPKAKGQARGNSGVYLQDRYEVQVLDSFGLEGLDNECGGIYSFKAPTDNMCYPPLAWQTYDVDFTAARYDGDEKVKDAMVTVTHNGVVIHEDLELPNESPGRQGEGADPAGIYLQNHGNPVVYRNIWVVEKEGEKESE